MVASSKGRRLAGKLSDQNTTNATNRAHEMRGETLSGTALRSASQRRVHARGKGPGRIAQGGLGVKERPLVMYLVARSVSGDRG
jgi:hypothetical protein